MPGKGEINNIEFSGCSVRILSNEVFTNLDYCLIFPTEKLEEVLSALRDMEIEALDAATFEILRVEAGQPGPAGELTEDFTPLEVGCQSMISDSKGCYTGQEIIARQITYDKVTKNLVGLRLDGRAQPGSSLVVDGKSVGVLTSFAHSPRFGNIGLGVLRRQFVEFGQQLTLTDPDGLLINAVVTKIPFTP